MVVDVPYVCYGLLPWLRYGCMGLRAVLIVVRQGFAGRVRAFSWYAAAGRRPNCNLRLPPK